LILREHDCQKDDPCAAIVLLQHQLYSRLCDKEEMVSGTKINTRSADEWDAEFARVGLFPIAAEPVHIRDGNPTRKYLRVYRKRPAAAIVATVAGAQSRLEPLFRELTPAMPRMQYTKAALSRMLHWGQLKLMLTEIEFLLMYCATNPLANLPEDAKIPILIYPGGAPGTHIEFLAEMFPHVNFVLYDPRPFHRFRSPKIQTFQQLFLQEDAKKWTSKEHPHADILLVSDIRTGDSSGPAPELEAAVAADHTLQESWYYIMQPKLTMFKFRLPWDDGTSEFPRGRIYVQPYARQNSSESRLIMPWTEERMKYSNRMYEEQFTYFNRVLRKRNYHNPLESMPLEDRRRRPNHWEAMTDNYDCAVEAYILEWYLKACQLPHDPKSIWELHCKLHMRLGGRPPAADLKNTEG
jgi:hypothetical protein